MIKLLYLLFIGLVLFGGMESGGDNVDIDNGDNDNGGIIGDDDDAKQEEVKEEWDSMEVIASNRGARPNEKLHKIVKLKWNPFNGRRRNNMLWDHYERYEYSCNLLKPSSEDRTSKHSICTHCYFDCTSDSARLRHLTECSGMFCIYFFFPIGVICVYL